MSDDIARTRASGNNKNSTKPATKATLERAWLYGFRDGGYHGLPARPSLRYFESPRPDVRNAYWDGYNTANQRSRLVSEANLKNTVRIASETAYNLGVAPEIVLEIARRMSS